jgi:hypothetical protein
MSDAALVDELHAYGIDARLPVNSHLPRDERIRLAAGQPLSERGLSAEAEDRLALRTRLRAARGATASTLVVAAEHARQIAARV